MKACAVARAERLNRLVTSRALSLSRTFFPQAKSAREEGKKCLLYGCVREGETEKKGYHRAAKKERRGYARVKVSV